MLNAERNITLVVYLATMIKYLSFSLLILFWFSGLVAQQTALNKGTIRIQYSPGHPANSFIPSKILGAAFDGHSQGDIDLMLTPENVKTMLGVGLKPVTYRLRTELGVEAWHWNPEGTWSEAGLQQGYWVSADHSSKPIQICNGYQLPRRGNTHDQANDNNYSRIDDGDTVSFWKSNPYLDEYFTKESNFLHPQWVVIDLGKLTEVNAIRIQWAEPYALSFTADYAMDIGKAYFDPLVPGIWHAFSKGTITGLHGENKIIKISDKPVKVRFVRITMTESSHTSPAASSDIRDRAGFAIKEIDAGSINKKGKFHDLLQHAPNNKKQTIIDVSSTDPWHRAIDRDVNTEQAGVDRFFESGLPNDQPAMMPLAVLYDTPENMEAFVHYLLSKHYPVEELEMGEEPEGQLMTPEDYACLYAQWATPIKKIAPQMKLGGPCFAYLSPEEDLDEESFTEGAWTSHFLNYLRAHNSIDNFNFFSFEWYPFDEICESSAPQLAIAPHMLADALSVFKTRILPPNTPVYVTEYGYSSQSGRVECDIEGALMYADILGQFLTLGGDKAFLYGYEPTYPDQNHGCGWGNNMLFGMDENGKIIYHTAAYYGVQMLLQQWAMPADSKLEIYPATCDIVNKEKQPLVSAYAIHRPDNKWAVAIINKDPDKNWEVYVHIFNKIAGTLSPLQIPLQCTQYSRLQYYWKEEGPESHPSLELPPVKKVIGKDDMIELPPYSLTVISE